MRTKLFLNPENLGLMASFNEFEAFLMPLWWKKYFFGNGGIKMAATAVMGWGQLVDPDKIVPMVLKNDFAKWITCITFCSIYSLNTPLPVREAPWPVLNVNLKYRSFWDAPWLDFLNSIDVMHHISCLSSFMSPRVGEIDPTGYFGKHFIIETSYRVHWIQ